MIATIRPRTATVVSVIWLYLGPSCTLAGLTGFVGGAAVLSLLPNALDAEASFFAMPAVFLGLAISGVVGTAGAWKLLGLTSRGRALLEAANWISVAAIALFTFVFVRGVATKLDYFGNRVARGEGFDMGLKAVLVSAVLAVPFVIMARKLRAPDLQFAIRDAEARR